jgi:DNA-binding transcriptional ArsR family regulator
MRARPAVRPGSRRSAGHGHWPVRAYHVVLTRLVVAGGRGCGRMTRAWGHARPPGGAGRLDAVLAGRLADTMFALSTPSRVLILGCLLAGPRSVTDITEALGMEQSAVSHQLRVLREHQLVRAERAGRSRCTPVRRACQRPARGGAAARRPRPGRAGGRPPRSRRGGRRGAVTPTPSGPAPGSRAGVTRAVFTALEDRRSVLDRAHRGDITGALGRIPSQDTSPRHSLRGRTATLLAVMGPGVVVLAADNDAGGISTYAQVGEDYGLQFRGIAGESRAACHHLRHRGDGDELGARLAVQVDEHREQELDAVALDRGRELRGCLRRHASFCTCHLLPPRYDRPPSRYRPVNSPVGEGPWSLYLTAHGARPA